MTNELKDATGIAGDEHDDLAADIGTDEADIAEPDEAGFPGPLKSIRAACLKCQGATGKPRREHREAVAECPSVSCPLHAMRFGRRPDPAANDPATPVRPHELGRTLGDILGHERQRRTAIRSQCLDCVGFERREIAACTTWKCPLYPFRLGTSHPADRGNVEERRALWKRIGHEAYVKAMNALLCSADEDPPGSIAQHGHTVQI